MKKNMMGLAVAAALSLVAISASAEDMYRGAWYAVPGASYLNTDSDVKSDDGAGAFIRLGKEISDHWDVQVGGGYARADQNTGVAGTTGRFKQTLLGVDALYMFSREKLRPFLLVGMGAARNNVDYSTTVANKANTSFMGNIGLGVQYLVTDNIGLQADLRQVWSNADAKPLPNSTIGNTYLNLGGIFRFGAPAPVAMAAPEPAPVVVEAPKPAPVAVVTPEPAPMAAAPACKPTLETVTITAEKLFGFDKAKLKDEGKAALDDAAAKIKANPDVELVMVTGHTDRIGSDKYNQKLSERRANQVKDYLVAQGIDASRLHAVGKGEAEPVVACAGVKGKKAIECLAPNRRVVLSAEKTRESGCK